MKYLKYRRKCKRVGIKPFDFFTYYVERVVNFDVSMF